MAAEFLITTCQGPWWAGGRLEDREIQEIAEIRVPRLVAALDADDKRLLDPYSLTRMSDDDDDEHPPLEESISEWVLEEVSRLLLGTREWATQGHGVTFQWVTGGVSQGDVPTDAYDAIRSFDVLRLWNESVSTVEVEHARAVIARKRAEGWRKARG